MRLWNTKWKYFFWTGFLVCLLSCGGNEAGTGVSNPPTISTVSASAASSVFSSNEGANLSAHIEYLLHESVQAFQEGEPMMPECEETDPACTCAMVGDSPENVTDAGYAEPGNYGSVENGVAIEDGDTCLDEEGDENSGMGPDGNGRFAAFTINDSVTIDCGDDGEILMQSGSGGVYRSIPDEENNPAGTEIHGIFYFDFDGEEFSLDCSMIVDEDEVITQADCSDENGNTIDQDTDATCTVDAD